MIFREDSGLLRDTDIRSILRYLGFKGGEVPPAAQKELDRCFEEMQDKAELRAEARLFPLRFLSEEHFFVGDLEIHSRYLGRNLGGCEEAYMMAATLGMGTERLLRKTSLTNVGEHMYYQAVAAAMTDTWCDWVNDRLLEESRASGFGLRSRFSPGFGDLSLELQRDFMRILEMQKHLGITLTDGLMMLPTKSVTAFIGRARLER